MNRIIRVFTVSALAAGIAACGGGNDTGSTGTVSIGLTDAPALKFSNVTIAFTGMALKPEGGKWIEFDFPQNKTWNLLELQGGLSEPLITDEEIPAGPYSEVRLLIDTSQSFVNLASAPDVPKTLAVPSGEQSGLKLKGEMVVAADTTTDFTIDFNVQESIVDPEGQSLADYLLKPSLRLVNNLEVGSISGLVDYGTILQEPGGCSEDYEGAVYVYQGADIAPTDLNVNLEDSGPLMTIPVSNPNQNSLYEYTAAFLTEGQYTVSYSCQLDDNGTTEELEFLGTQTVTVVANTETKAETIPLAP
ncbi:DUF4382 domain-containing protein [Marinobacter sp. F4216]|uniref:DUF4382 domain-containing protein n=1 Tax=Marinobacter sp. F4216 TaxID=2874281 RepID=UPI001CC00B66|nr:DUF4382 domain-containing protein [Marinobacter sp. F4216]MBZ2170410.1 DUF4382 domain-containing protein [Marinobacter sp. F4216]